MFTALVLTAQASAYVPGPWQGGGCAYPVFWANGQCAQNPPQWPTSPWPI